MKNWALTEVPTKLRPDLYDPLVLLLSGCRIKHICATQSNFLAHNLLLDMKKLSHN